MKMKKVGNKEKQLAITGYEWSAYEQYEVYKRAINKYKLYWKPCGGLCWTPKHTNYTFAVSTDSTPKKFVHYVIMGWHTKWLNRKDIFKCARAWAKGNMSGAKQFYRFLRSSTEYNYEDLLTKHLSGILTDKEQKKLNRWHKFKEKVR